MKAQTALAIIIAASSVFLLLGFYGYAAPYCDLPTVYCGDMMCNCGETPANCPGDCVTGNDCGNGAIEPGEGCDNGVNNGACPASCSSSCAINDCGSGGTGSTCPALTSANACNSRA